MKTFLSRAIAGSVFALACAVLVLPAAAHESRETESGVTAVVGWAEEPAYTGFPNAVQIRLADGAGNPIDDLAADALQVEVLFGDEKVGPLPLEPAFGSPGEYLADVIPTRSGTYSFHFIGTVGGEPYDETFTSGEETFAEPRNPADVSFPAQDPTNGELAESIEQLRAQISDGDGSGGGNGTTMGIVALVVAVIALAIALSARSKKTA